MLRAFGRVLLDILLRTFYLIGWLAGGLLVAALTIIGAVRLGWSDVRKRGRHGAG